MEKKEHYVYMVIDKETFDVKYIGKGKGKRCFNILSGVSNNYEANKAHHEGTASNCEVHEVYTDLSNSLAITIEKAMIYAIQPEWNSDHKKIVPNVDRKYFLLGLRIKTLIELFKSGLWKDGDDRVSLFLGLLNFMLCDTSDKAVKYIVDAWSDQSTDFRSDMIRLWATCNNIAEYNY